jgi:hypothetical protein
MSKWPKRDRAAHSSFPSADTSMMKIIDYCQNSWKMKFTALDAPYYQRLFTEGYQDCLKDHCEGVRIAHLTLPSTLIQSHKLTRCSSSPEAKKPNAFSTATSFGKSSL